MGGSAEAGRGRREWLGLLGGKRKERLDTVGAKRGVRDQEYGTGEVGPFICEPRSWSTDE